MISGGSCRWWLPLFPLIADLNGGSRPAWLDDLHRDSEENAQALTGARIFATGPTVPDLEKPGRTVLDDSEGSKVDRARLMDVLFLISSKSSEDTPAEVKAAINKVVKT